jgi:hypothetical protein
VASLALSTAGAELALRALFHQDDYYFLRYRYDVNSRGMRDTEHSTDASGRPRILVVGDSYAFGQGVVHASDTFPRILERQLRRGCGRTDIEVVVGARMGWDIDDISSYLGREGLGFRPALVLYAFALNDFQTTETPRWTHPGLLGETVDRMFTSSMLYYGLRKLKGSLLVSLGLRHSYAQYLGDLCAPETNPHWPAFVTAFDRISNEVGGIGAPLVVAILPLMTDFDDRYPLRPCHARVQALARGNGDYPLDLLEAFQKAGLDGRRLSAASFDPHPNETAHRVIATALATRLLGGGLRSRVCGSERDTAGQPD